ncbi:MAG TPA: SDR family oxidoreductase [Bacteroidetes bacterium]|nr:SDR family oxidoreductase [Bacteroidota bacterium]
MKKGYALVTGASSGIGAEIAKILAQKGYSLLIIARRAERLEALRTAILAIHDVDVVVLAQDLAVPLAGKILFDAVQQGGYSVEILVNNAGFGIQGKFLEMEMKDVEQMFRLNMSTLTALTQLFAQEMVAKGNGYILQVASAVAFLPSPYVSAYAATKAYVLSFSESLRYELKDTGVSITTLYPGITTTEFNAVADAKTPAMMNMSILSAEKVAQIGIKAMFQRRRARIPGFINNMSAFFAKIIPRSWIINSAGSLMKKANQQ